MNYQKPATKARPGDLIEIRRTLFTHWALYIGDGDVVHLTSDDASEDTSTRFFGSEEIAVIKREPLAQVAGSDPWQVNNGSDSIWKPLPVGKIIKKAKKMIGCKVQYNVLNANCEHFVNSLRYGTRISFQPATEARPGDLIKIRRTLFTHWALYIGDGDVVHLTSDDASEDTSTRFFGSEEIAVIKREPLAEVAGSDPWQVNNGSDSIWKPLPVGEIIKKAKKMIGCKVQYNVLNANCEHFVISLRYRTRISFQPATKARPGDLIKIRRTLFTHWALYIGDGDVVHLTSDDASEDTSTRFFGSEEIAVIKREPLAEVAGSDPWQVNNGSDSIWKPLPVGEIIKKAKNMIGCKVQYNVLNANCEHFVNSLRYGTRISFQPATEARPGDLIKIRRTLFTHWALYIGDGDVVHLTSDDASEDTSTRFFGSEEIAVIKREPLAEVARSDPWQVNNGSDSIWKPLPVGEIIKKAKKMIGCKVQYNVLNANCEHFVNSLRYGTPISFQPATKARPGDLIKIRRTLFTHWALYIGDGDVVHLTSDDASEDTSTRFFGSEEIAVIKREPLAEVAGSDPWQVNNGSDSIWKPLPVGEIIKKAKNMIGCKVQYNVLNANCEHFVNSLRYGTRISFQPATKARPGDLIKIRRTLFTHWALYIGDGDVVHLTSDGASGDTSTRFSSSTEFAVIKREPLAEVAGSDPWQVNNGSDRIWNPLPVDEIIRKAKNMIGCKVQYNVLNANCEHFVNSLRYRTPISFQVIGIGLLFVGAAVLSPVAVAAAAVGGVIGALMSTSEKSTAKK